jgi:hypothetical protein
VTTTEIGQQKADRKRIAKRDEEARITEIMIFFRSVIMRDSAFERIAWQAPATKALLVVPRSKPGVTVLTVAVGSEINRLSYLP